MAVRGFEVAEVRIAGMAGWQIHAIYRDCPDSHWETIAHAAIFRDRWRADAFLKKALSRSGAGINWQYWGVPPGAVISQASAQQGHVAPFSVI